MLHNMHNCTIDNVFECVKEEDLYFRGSRRLGGGGGGGVVGLELTQSHI